MPPTSPAAFISHSSRDAGAAFEMCQLLEKRDLKCWIAPRDVMPGDDYAAEIVRGIECSGSMVLLVSSHSNTSSHVLREVEQAIRLGKPIFPVLLEKVQLSRALNYYIAPIHWIAAMQGPLDGSADTVASAIRRESDWQVSAMAPSLKRRVSYRLDAYLAALTGGLISAMAGLAVVYFAWSSHLRDQEAQRDSSYLSLGFVSLTGEGSTSPGSFDVRATVYLSVPDVHFSNVRLRVAGADIDDHADGDLSKAFSANALSPQSIVFTARRLPVRIVTCLSAPRPNSGPRFRVTQTFGVTPRDFNQLEFSKATSEALTPEDGRPCGAS